MHLESAGASSFQTLERLLSLRAFDTFLFGTAMFLHLPLNSAFQQIFQNLQSGIALIRAAPAGCFVEIRPTLRAQAPAVLLAEKDLRQGKLEIRARDLIELQDSFRGDQINVVEEGSSSSRTTGCSNCSEILRSDCIRHRSHEKGMTPLIW